jgi:hypothetical protein
VNEKVTVIRMAGDLKTQVMSKPIARSDVGVLSVKFHIRTVLNEARCAFMNEEHELPLLPCCPVSGNPQGGSTISINYEPFDKILEVASLRAYIDSYQGGRGEVRSMEGMVQAIAQDCADSVGVCVVCSANLVIEPAQRMKLKATAFPIHAS